VLGRGYAIAYGEDGGVISSAAQTDAGSKLLLRLSDGRFPAGGEQAACMKRFERMMPTWRKKS
jgi:exonuclease VII large subunit